MTAREEELRRLLRTYLAEWTPEAQDRAVAAITALFAADAGEREAEINRMVDRFLGWRLPETFHPDGGITFEPIHSKGTPYEGRRRPSGTNLFTAIEAREMVRWMLDAAPSSPTGATNGTH